MENDGCNVHKLRLNSGRDVTLISILQSRTYGGESEGYPNKFLNDNGSIKSALHDATKLAGSKGEPILIPPARRDYMNEPGDMLQERERLSERMRPEWLPSVLCIGVFESNRPARDQAKDASSLTIVWYQDDFGIDPAAMDHIRMIDWDQHATDTEY